MKKIFQGLFSKGKLRDRAEQEIPASKLLGQSQPSTMSATSATISLGEKSLGITSTPLKPVQFIVGCGQSIGLHRDKNQDTLYSFTANLAGDHEEIPFGLYIVADGMGGHQKGELASGIAVRVLAEYVLLNLYLPLIRRDQTVTHMSFQEVLQGGVNNARQAIFNQVPEGGTTLTAVLMAGDRMVITHVGDSRVYAVDLDGKIEALTRDHSLVKRLQELGQITSEEAATHPQRNVLYRALGQGESVEADIITQRLPSAGYLLLCSDGLWGVISEENIARTITEASNPQQACKDLIEAANLAGGPDNISVIVVQLPTQ